MEVKNQLLRKLYKFVSEFGTLSYDNYKSLSLLEKYFTFKDIESFKGLVRCPALDEIVLEDFESLIALLLLNQGSRRIGWYEYGLRRSLEDYLEEAWGLECERFLFKVEGASTEHVDDRRDNFVNKVIQKFFSLTEEQKNELIRNASLLISENFDNLLEHLIELKELSFNIIEEIFYNKYIDIKLKRKLYDYMMSTGKFLSFEYCHVLCSTPELLSFPNIFYFLNKISIISVFSEFSNDKYVAKDEWLIKTEAKRKHIFDILREAYSKADVQGKEEIRNKLYSAKAERYSWFFEELEREQILTNEFVLVENVDIEEELGKQLLSNATFSPHIIIQLLVKYTEQIRDKYGLNFNVMINSTDINSDTLGCYSHPNTLFINTSLIEWTQKGILRAISTVNHEVIHALQFQKEFNEKNDYNTLVQVIDSNLDRDGYRLNYAHISFENDANARAYTETMRFVTKNCPELMALVQENLARDLDVLRERIRLIHNGVLSFEAMPVIFMFLSVAQEKQLTLLNKYPLFKKVFYYDTKEQKLKMYSETHFRNLLVVAKFRRNKKDIEFYENILLDFKIRKYLQKNPTGYYDDPDYLEELDRKVRGRK